MSLCTLCKKQLPESSEAWTAPDGQVVHVARSEVPSAMDDTSVGEFEICEACYQRGLPAYFTPEDVAEIHYQFGLEYCGREQFSRSIESLTRARRIAETADVMAALGHAEGQLGNREIAIAHYRRALEIDPSHFMASQNLRNLDSGKA